MAECMDDCLAGYVGTDALVYYLTLPPFLGRAVPCLCGEAYVKARCSVRPSVMCFLCMTDVLCVLYCVIMCCLVLCVYLCPYVSNYVSGDVSRNNSNSSSGSSESNDDTST